MKWNTVKLRIQDTNGANPFAIERTAVLYISLASVDVVSQEGCRHPRWRATESQSKSQWQSEFEELEFG
ncbi:hypothetical protein D1007_17908 [Hordeum vulgare]|nr:hypothetical protein D1007_17908 [Hordeum vulgare]